MRRLWAVAALSAVAIATTPTYGDSVKSHPEQSKGEIAVGMIQSDEAIDHAGFSPDLIEHGSGTWNVYPDVKTYLTALVLYNPRTCQEVSAGGWVVKSGAKWGNIYYNVPVHGKLVSGACHNWVYTGAGIYYKWVVATTARTDEFKANWYAPSNEIIGTFHLNLK